jgi:hypothetical protein
MHQFGCGWKIFGHFHEHDGSDPTISRFGAHFFIKIA